MSKSMFLNLNTAVIFMLLFFHFFIIHPLAHRLPNHPLDFVKIFLKVSMQFLFNLLQLVFAGEVFASSNALHI